MHELDLHGDWNKSASCKEEILWTHCGMNFYPPMDAGRKAHIIRLFRRYWRGTLSLEKLYGGLDLECYSTFLLEKDGGLVPDKYGKYLKRWKRKN